MPSEPVLRRYGVLQQEVASTAFDRAVERLRLLGYAIIDGGYDRERLGQLSEAFEGARAKAEIRSGGRELLERIDEHNTIRLPLFYDGIFLDLATNPVVLEVCRRLIPGYFILNQQNGVINPAHEAPYNQGAWHRDLPYQHFVSTRPLAINALFCLDEFTLDNGATMVIPASHRQEAFPSDETVSQTAVTVTAPAGAFVVLDCMTYHCGGVNRTAQPRRSVNQVYSVPLLRQQIDLPVALGEEFSDDRDIRRLLGYEVRVPGSIEEYLKTRQRRELR